MKTYFIGRHPGAVEWAKAQGFGDALMVAHFDPECVQPGDVVLGTLPVPLASEVCRRGGEYHHLTMDLPVEARGKELTAADMAGYGARLEKFQVGPVLQGAVEDWYERIGEYAMAERPEDRSRIQVYLGRQGCTLKLHTMAAEDLDVFIERLAGEECWRVNVSKDAGDIFGQIHISDGCAMLE